MRNLHAGANSANAAKGQAGLIKPRTGKEGETDRVYRILKEAILQCKLAPGDFLIEADLARQCNTSRTPVREACNRLSQEGWIAQIRYKGYRIPDISVREIADLYEYRNVLECFTCGKAAERASDEQLQALAASIEVEKTVVPKPELLLEANEMFHLMLATIAGNQRIYDQLKYLLEHVHRLDVLGVSRHSEWRHHQDILAALNARNPEQARKAMAAHLDSSRNQMLQLLGGAL